MYESGLDSAIVLTDGVFGLNFLVRRWYCCLLFAGDGVGGVIGEMGKDAGAWKVPETCWGSVPGEYLVSRGMPIMEPGDWGVGGKRLIGIGGADGGER
jgi:hypothetical protein